MKKLIVGSVLALLFVPVLAEANCQSILLSGQMCQVCNWPNGQTSYQCAPNPAPATGLGGFNSGSSGMAPPMYSQPGFVPSAQQRFDPWAGVMRGAAVESMMGQAEREGRALNPR